MDGKAVGSSSTPSNMRDWRPNDATKCGIFGIWLSDGAGTSGINTMCPGTSSTTHYCCAIDVAVAPLQYLFYQYPQTLDQLDGVCNKAFSTNAYTVDRSYPIFSKTAIQTLVAKIGRYYAIPKVNGQQTIKLYMNMLNSLLNEFSPPVGDIPASKNYVQIVDCSVRLYNLLQSLTLCPDPSN